MYEAAKLRWAGGAQRPFWHVKWAQKDGCAQRTGAHARPKPTSVFRRKCICKKINIKKGQTKHHLGRTRLFCLSPKKKRCFLKNIFFIHFLWNFFCRGKYYFIFYLCLISFPIDQQPCMLSHSTLRKTYKCSKNRIGNRSMKALISHALTFS